MIALIDGDSIAYILGHVHRDHQFVDQMHSSIDSFLDNIFRQTGANMYYGALASEQPCFRYDLYKVKPYKGNRPELSEYMAFWKPIVMGYLKNRWNFDYADGLEADDLINTAACSINAECEVVICSVDKDLKQIAGLHFNYRTNEFSKVDGKQAAYNFFTLMLMGDDTDNVAGIPGYGEKKTMEKLRPLLDAGADWSAYEELVRILYQKHFGPYYGNIIYEQTQNTIALVWDRERDIQFHSVPEKPHPFDLLTA